MSTPQSVDTQSAGTPPAEAPQQDLAEQHGQSAQSMLPSEFVFQLILEQFWGDGVSKREIRSVYTTAADANAACHDYLLRTWPQDQFSLYEVGASPQRAELAKVSALIDGDRFHVWIERHTWEGTLDFSSKAIAKRAGKGPNAYILQRTIKDASGGKRRSTTRGIFATRHLAKQALAQDEPPSEWSSNQGYVLEPGGEYAHALSPSGKTAWLFIEVRPLYMSYTPLDVELQETGAGTGAGAGAASIGTASSSHHLGASALNPISLDHADDRASSAPPSPSTLLHPTHLSVHHPRSSIDNPFSPMPSNPDEAGAFVYLVLQLKTIPYTPPILTVEAVAYEIEVANRFGIALLEGFTGQGAMFEPVFREDGCLQGSIEQRTRDEGLTVWVEKRTVVLGDENLDFDLMSEHGSVQLNRAYQESEQRNAGMPFTGPAVVGGQKREEPDDGFEAEGRPTLTRPQIQVKSTRLSQTETEKTGEELVIKKGVNLEARYKVVLVSHGQHSLTKPSTGPPSAAATEAATPPSTTSSRTIVDSSEDRLGAIVSARLRFYSSLANQDVATLHISDNLGVEYEEGKKYWSIEARSLSHPPVVLQEIAIEDNEDH